MITWDESKRLINLDKHGVDFEMIEGKFFERAIIIPSYAGRARAVGRLDGKVVVVIFKALGSEALSIISARPANAKERELLK